MRGAGFIGLDEFVLSRVKRFQGSGVGMEVGFQGLEVRRGNSCHAPNFGPLSEKIRGVKHAILGLRFKACGFGSRVFLLKGLGGLVLLVK